MENVYEIVRTFIVDTVLSGAVPEIDLDDVDLQEAGVLDSLSTLKLVCFLEERFSISVMPEEMGGDDLSSMKGIEQLVKVKLTVPS
jgi:acyl carrier protein